MIGRSTRHIIEFLLLAALGAGLLAGLCAWRLSQGPVNLGFLNGHIEFALNGLGVPFRLEIDGTHVSWAGWERALDLRISGLRAVDQNNRTLAHIDETSVRFSFRGLMRGVVAPRSLDILGPSVRVIRNGDGTVQFAMGGKNDAAPANIGLFDKIVQGLRDEDDPERPITYLRRISVIGADLVLDDNKTGAFWKARNTDFILLSGSAGSQATFSAELDIEGKWMELDGSASLSSADEQVVVTVHLSNLRPDALASRIGRLKPLKGVRLALDGTVTMNLSAQGGPRKIGFHLTSGAGQIDDKEFWQQEIRVKSALLRGTVDLENERADIRNFRFDLNGPIIDVAATGQQKDGVLDASVDAKFEGLKAKNLGRLWPINVAQGGRRWVVKNIAAGDISDGRVSAEIRVDGETGAVGVPKLAGRARIDGVKISYMDGMPAIVQARGTAEIGLDQILFRLEGGESRGVAIETGTVALTELDRSKEYAKVDVTLLGSLKDKVGIINVPRLRYATRFGLDPKTLGGEARTRLRLVVPLIDAVTFDDIKLSAASSMTGAAIPGVAAGKDVTDGTFTMNIDLAGLELTGDARILGAPAEIRWIERFGQNEKYVRQIEAKSVLAQPQWEEFGFGFFSERLSGPVGVDLALLQPSGGKPMEIVAKLQMQDATMRFEELGWNKPPGEVALGWVTAFIARDGGINVRNFNMATAGLKVSGGLLLDPKGRLIRLDLSSFVLNETNLQLVATPDTETGGLAITVRGRSYDASRIFDAGLNEATATDQLPLTINLELNRLILSKETRLNAVSGKIVRDAKGWRSARLVSKLPAGMPMKINFDAGAENQTISISADDAGEVVKFFDISDAVKGGKLRILAKRLNAKPKDGWAGVAEMTDFSLVDAPVLARMLTLASLSGILNTLSGQGVAFARFHAPFRWQNDALRVANARAFGSELGITGEGSYDLNRDILDISGTIVPAYTINSVLGNIAILGSILTGKKGSGVFAATYRVVGKGADPGVKVNALSALAPGFLRNLIGIFDSGDAAKTGPGESKPKEGP